MSATRSGKSWHKGLERALELARRCPYRLSLALMAPSDYRKVQAEFRAILTLPEYGEIDTVIHSGGVLFEPARDIAPGCIAFLTPDKRLAVVQRVRPR